MDTILTGNNNDNDNPGIQDTSVVTGGGQETKMDPAPYDYSTMVGADGILSDNWRQGLPESIRNERCLDNIKNIGLLAQSYVHAQRAIGQNKVAVPNEHSTPEEWSAFYKAGGRPDSEDGYSTDQLQLPDGVSLDSEKVADFKKFAFANGMSQKTFEAALNYDIQRVQNQVAAEAAAASAEYAETKAKLKADEASGALREQFGPEAATAEGLIAQCNKAIQTFGLGKVLQEKGLLNNYEVITALARIGSKMSESKLKGSDIPPTASNPQIRLEEIRNNPDDPFYKKEHPAHDARVAEVNRLLAEIEYRTNTL